MRLHSLLLVVFAGQLWCSVAMGADPASGNMSGFSVVPTATMDDPRRYEWQKPEKVMDSLLIRKGNVVADVGAGTGFFTVLFAQRVGTGGTVLAADIDPDMLAKIDRRAKKAGLANIKTIQATPDNPQLKAGTVDLIFMCDTYVFLDDRVQYLTRLRNGLKKGGRLAVVSFNMKDEIPGAPPPNRRVSREQIIGETVQSGFVLEAEYFFLPYQYFLVFAKGD